MDGEGNVSFAFFPLSGCITVARTDREEGTIG